MLILSDRSSDITRELNALVAHCFNKYRVCIRNIVSSCNSECKSVLQYEKDEKKREVHRGGEERCRRGIHYLSSSREDRKRTEGIGECIDEGSEHIEEERREEVILDDEVEEEFETSVSE